MLLGHCQEAGVLGKELTKESIGVLVGRSLPGTVRVAEIDGCLESCRRLLVRRELLAVVHGQGSAGQPLQAAADRFPEGLCLVVLELPGDEEPGLAVHQGHEAACAPFPGDGVALPVADPASGSGLRRALLDGYAVRDGSPFLFSLGLSRDSMLTEFLLEDDGKQSALKRTVDGRDAQGEAVMADDLFRRPVARKPENDMGMDFRLKDLQQWSA